MSELLTEAEQLYNLGQVEDARERFEELLRSDSGNKQALNNLGVLAFEENKIGEAARYFTQALEIDPFYKDAIFNICDLLRDNGNLDAAGSLLEMAVIKYPDDNALVELRDESLNGNTSAPEIKESLISNDDEKNSESESVKTLREKPSGTGNRGSTGNT